MEGVCCLLKQVKHGQTDERTGREMGRQTDE